MAIWWQVVSGIFVPKKYQNLIIGFQVTVENVRDVFLRQCIFLQHITLNMMHVSSQRISRQAVNLHNSAKTNFPLSHVQSFNQFISKALLCYFWQKSRLPNWPWTDLFNSFIHTTGFCLSQSSNKINNSKNKSQWKNNLCLSLACPGMRYTQSGH